MRNTRDCKRKYWNYRKVSSDRNIYGDESVNQLTEEEHKAVHRYFQLESEKEMIEEEYIFIWDRLK